MGEGRDHIQVVVAGSGYVGGVSSGSMQSGVRSGNGYVTITLV